MITGRNNKRAENVDYGDPAPSLRTLHFGIYYR